MKLDNNSYIAGIGYYVPKKILTNFDLEKMVETSDEWITTRTGIKTRHIVEDNETSSMLGTEAAKKALLNANLKPEDIDFTIVATITPDMIFPSTAALISNNLGIHGKAVLDIEAACTGFIYGLSIADQFIKTGKYKNILVIAAETLSKITDWKDRNTCVLFGDGSGAAVVSVSKSESKIIDFYLGGDGAYKDLLYIEAGGSLHPASEETVRNRMHYMKMKGNETFKVAVTKMSECAKEILERNNIKQDEISLLIAHQANERIIRAVQKSLGLPDEKVYINLDKYGNTSAASIPIALAEAVEKKLIKRGDLILLVAFGGGLTWGSMLIKW